MNTLNKQLVTLAAAFLMVVGLSGCNTVEGFGKDLKKVGEKIEKKADEVTESVSE